MSIIIQSLSYTHPNREALFHSLSLALSSGDKVALVGRNGAGKSTFLQLISGQLLPVGGEIITAENLWYVPQHLGDYDDFSIGLAMGVEKKLAALQAILAGNINQSNFDELQDDWEIEKKVSLALKKWGLDGFALDQNLGTLSGGQKTKVFLAGIDLHDPKVILLDEPSNHLDRATRKKLYELIAQSRATILVVSHDKTLLGMMNKTLELTKTGIEVFGGNYEFYQIQKQEKVNALQAQLNEQSKALKQSEKKAVDMAYQRQRQEARGKSAGQSHSMPRIVSGGLKSKSQRSTARVLDAQHEKITDMHDHIRETRSQIQLYQPLKINIGSSTLHHDKLLIDAQAITFGYNQPLLKKAVNVQVRSGERLHITGDNGSGKTTLLKVLIGALQPLTGTSSCADFSYIYLDQDYSIIDPILSVYEQLQRYNAVGLEEHEIKAMLIYSQFDTESFNKKCGALSGGEKMKLALCCLSIIDKSPDMLILDEPTNNLDVQSLEVLISAIQRFDGTLLVISHDEAFITEIGINREINLSE